MLLLFLLQSKDRFISLFHIYCIIIYVFHSRYDLLVFICNFKYKNTHTPTHTYKNRHTPTHTYKNTHTPTHTYRNRHTRTDKQTVADGLS